MSPPTRSRPGGTGAAEAGFWEDATEGEFTSGVSLRDEGAAAAADAAWPLWRIAADEHLDVLAASGREFTADDLVAEVGLPPVTGSPNAVGGLFLGAVRRGLVEPVGFTHSRRPSRHRGVVRVYRGVGS